MAAVARRNGRAPNVMKSVAAGPEPLLMPSALDMELRYCSTSCAQELLGLAHPSRLWSKTRKAETVAKARWLVLMVTETESDAVVGMRAPG